MTIYIYTHVLGLYIYIYEPWINIMTINRSSWSSSRVWNHHEFISFRLWLFLSNIASPATWSLAGTSAASGKDDTPWGVPTARSIQVNGHGTSEETAVQNVRTYHKHQASILYWYDIHIHQVQKHPTSSIWFSDALLTIFVDSWQVLKKHLYKTDPTPRVKNSLHKWMFIPLSISW